MTQAPENSGDKRTNRVLDTAMHLGASGIAGAVGTAVGGVVGGIEGAMIGGALGNIAAESIMRVNEDIRSRMLSRRERARVDSVVEWAQQKVRQRLDAGDQVRDDGFFAERSGNGRLEADELAEGVLLKAKNEHQEKKLRFLGALIANISFRSDVSPELGNVLLRLAESLSYRQFCVLALGGRGEALPINNLIALPHRENAEFEALRQEMLAMHSDLFDPRPFIEDGEFRFDVTSVGRITYELLDLHEVPEGDLQSVRDVLLACRAEEDRRADLA